MSRLAGQGKFEMKKVVLFGATGGLGSAIGRFIEASSKYDLITAPWAIASIWDIEDIRRWFEATIGDHEADIVLASGLTDPARPSRELMASNVEFPMRMIAATRDRGGMRYVTVGSVMENILADRKANSYIASKIALGQHILKLEPAVPATHLRLHTLYGATSPHPHMFLGQIAQCLQDDSPFEMSTGVQYRQYHHVDDIARVVVNFLDRPWCVSETVEINGPETVRLVDLARAIFSHFHKPALLRVGARPTLAGEILDRPDYPVTPHELFPRVRPTLPGTIAWMEELIEQGPDKSAI